METTQQRRMWNRLLIVPFLVAAVAAAIGALILDLRPTMVFVILFPLTQLALAGASWLRERSSDERK